MTNDEGKTLNAPSDKKIKADATKDFFVTMITRDISLRDCIFDLLDNAIDGARRRPSENATGPFSGYRIEVDFDATKFEVTDNCGGILLSDAINYAFHFGRRPDSKSDVKGGIGLYGIGMKRAIFKIGRHCEVKSQAEDAAFKVIVDVGEWERRADWDFEYELLERADPLGTNIKIDSINEGVRQVLNDPAFSNELIKAIARDYAFFIQEGLSIVVGGTIVPSYQYRLVQSDHVAPAVEEYDDDGVHVRVLAGIVDRLPDDVPDELLPDDRFGWFVVCNRRVVLAADKTEKTIWGDDRFNVWHGQYNGFAGFVFFSSDDQRKLPWTTTKRELDSNSALYRRAIERMKAVSKVFIDYTNRRKADLEAAQKAEATIKLVNISEFKQQQTLKLPTLSGSATRRDYVTISYRKAKSEVEEIRQHLGQPYLTAKDVGQHTFEYFVSVELGK